MVNLVVTVSCPTTTALANFKRHLFEESVVNFCFGSEVVYNPGVREEDSGRK